MTAARSAYESPSGGRRELSPWLGTADLLSLGLVVAIFCWICFRNIWQPGLYGDEAWPCVTPARFVWGEAVVNPIPHQQFRLLGHAFPLMLNSYTGPVKAYILAAAFGVFGATVPVLRMTTGAVGLLGVIAFYFLARAEFGRLAAAPSALLLSTDVSYVLAVRSPWPLTDFALLARVFAILLLLSWQRNRARLTLLFFGSLALGLGLSHKFDFLGTIVAVAVGGAVFYGAWLRPRVKEAAVAAGGLLLGAWPILLYNALAHWATLSTGAALSRSAAHEALGPAVVHRFHILEDLLGGGIGEFFLGEPFQRSSFFGGSLVPAALLLLPIPLCLLLISRSLRPWLRPLGFFLTVFFVMLLLIAEVPMAVGPQHVLSLYPFPHLFLGIGLAGLWQVGKSAPRGLLWPIRLAAASCFCLLLASNLLLAETFHERLAARGGARYWSESIYDLSAVLQKEYAGETVELLDWGFEQPLIILGKDKLRLDAVYWRILEDPAPGLWLAPLMREPGRVFVRRSAQFAFDKRVHERFDAVWREAPDLAVAERKFFQRNGELSFSILAFHPARPPAP